MASHQGNKWHNGRQRIANKLNRNVFKILAMIEQIKENDTSTEYLQ